MYLKINIYAHDKLLSTIYIDTCILKCPVYLVMNSAIKFKDSNHQ